MGYWTELRAWLLKDPAKLIRYLVLFICCIVVIVQLYECFAKLSHPPITTHSYYNVNDTIEMPGITLCRDPPYNEAILTNLSGGYCPHPRYATCWMNYPFGELDLTDFFTLGTYEQDETFFMYGLNGESSNVEIDSSLHFYLGRCYTVRPTVSLSRVSKSSGYSLILRHTIAKSASDSVDYITGTGWHIYIHDKRENFTEINMKGSGRVEYVFVDVNEEIEIKLQSQHFSNIQSRDDPCSTDESYSDLKCGEMCLWKDLVDDSNCTGPWMDTITYNQCNDSSSMRYLISSYKAMYESDDDFPCDCLQPCQSRIYSTYIQNRKDFDLPEPLTQIYIYYTTKLISMIEERPSYDTTQFIADIGGSLGFLLGLSVLGLIGIIEHMTLFFCGSCFKRWQEQQEKREDAADGKSQASDETCDVAVIYQSESENKSSKYQP